MSSRPKAPSPPVPVVLLSGYLGAGKTTYLNQILRHTPLDAAVVENELGAHDLDVDRLDNRPDRIVEVLDGCACCTQQAALHDALTNLAVPPRPELVLIEASGAADPLPIVRVLQADGLRDALRIREIVTLVDAIHAPASARFTVWQRQVRFADRILLTKTDADGAQPHAHLTALLREHNPSAPIGVAAAADAGASSHHHAAAGARETGDEHEHGHPFTTVLLDLAPDTDPDTIETWLRELTHRPAVELLRVKGALSRDGERHAFQGVRSRIERRMSPDSALVTGHLALIGTGLDEDGLRTELAERTADRRAST